MEAVLIAEDDGYGIIGYSYSCPNCHRFNRFIDYDLILQVCEKCKAVVIVYTTEAE